MSYPFESYEDDNEEEDNENDDDGSAQYSRYRGSHVQSSVRSTRYKGGGSGAIKQTASSRRSTGKSSQGGPNRALPSTPDPKATRSHPPKLHETRLGRQGNKWYSWERSDTTGKPGWRLIKDPSVIDQLNFQHLGIQPRASSVTPEIAFAAAPKSVVASAHSTPFAGGSGPPSPSTTAKPSKRSTMARAATDKWSKFFKSQSGNGSSLSVGKSREDVSPVLFSSLTTAASSSLSPLSSSSTSSVFQSSSSSVCHAAVAFTSNPNQVAHQHLNNGGDAVPFPQSPFAQSLPTTEKQNNSGGRHVLPFFQSPTDHVAPMPFASPLAVNATTSASWTPRQITVIESSSQKDLERERKLHEKQVREQHRLQDQFQKQQQLLIRKQEKERERLVTRGTARTKQQRSTPSTSTAAPLLWNTTQGHTTTASTTMMDLS